MVLDRFCFPKKSFIWLGGWEGEGGYDESDP